MSLQVLQRIGRLVAFFAIMGVACTYGHEDPQSGAYQPLVFPGEARLGASAFMVIDSNQFQIGDALERYDLHRDRVQILIEDDTGTLIPVSMRSVFALESGAATIDAESRPNAWVMVALFDLPTADDGEFNPPYPRHLPLLLEIDGVRVPELEGVIWLVGADGEATSFDATPLLPTLEDALEPETMVRLRARRDGPRGFQTEWTIGAIEAQIRFDPDCLAPLRAHAGSDATGGGATLGPPGSTSTSLDESRLLLSHPNGFGLIVATTADPTRLGRGPIIDLVFDRIQDPMCTGPLRDYVEIHGVRVHGTDGTTPLARPAAAAGVLESESDSSNLFHLHFVDPEQPE